MRRTTKFFPQQDPKSSLNKNNDSQNITMRMNKQRADLYNFVF